MMRTCKTCGSLFEPAGKTQSRYTYYCRACNNAYQREWRARNPQKFASYKQSYIPGQVEVVGLAPDCNDPLQIAWVGGSFPAMQFRASMMDGAFEGLRVLAGGKLHVVKNRQLHEVAAEEVAA